MTGTPEGYQKRLKTLYRVYGGKKEYEAVRKEWTSKGGQNSPGFRAWDKDKLRKQASEAGKIGRRTPPLKDYPLDFEDSQEGE